MTSEVGSILPDNVPFSKRRDTAATTSQVLERSAPVKSIQNSLFVPSTEEALVELPVSRDEVRLWQKKEWISFEIDAEKKSEVGENRDFPADQDHEHPHMG